MNTGEGAWIGFAPEVRVVERMLLSQVPEEKRGAFLSTFRGKLEFTRSGEPVFSRREYEAWALKQ
jgi:hypothetical protein